MNLSVRMIAIALSFSSMFAFAAKPTEINYVSKNKTLMGTEYRMYAVRCSDGKQTTISVWDKNEWCLGSSNNTCFTGQMEAATYSCNN